VSDLIEQQISESEYQFSARLEIDYINDKYYLKLPQSENYETIAGLILSYNKSIPSVNEEIIIEKFRFQILAATNARIDLVKVILPSE